MERTLQESSKRNFKTIQSTGTSNQKLSAIDGPPIDFSFKNIRRLEEMEGILNPKLLTVKFTEEQQKPKQLVKVDLSSFNFNEDDVPEISQPKFQIVRTIEVMDSKMPDQRNENLTKKTSKNQKKSKTIIDLKTTSLFLRYNKLTSIQNLKLEVNKIFPSIDQLLWIDLSHNRLTSLVEDFHQFPQLKNLYLHANFIANFKELEKLKNVKLLRTLTIHGNPLQNYAEFRVVVSAILPQVQKLDSTLLTKRDKERSQILMKSLKKLPVIKEPQLPPSDSDVQEDS